jgi:hypothetical protein
MGSNPSPYYRPLSATTVSIVIVIARGAATAAGSQRGINIAESGINTLPDISEDEDNDQRDHHKDQRVFDHRLPLIAPVPPRLHRRHYRSPFPLHPRHPLLFFCLAGLLSASNRGRVQGSINIAESGIDTLPDISEDEDHDQRDQHKDQRVFDHRLPVHTPLLKKPLDRRHCRHECFHHFFFLPWLKTVFDGQPPSRLRDELYGLPSFHAPIIYCIHKKTVRYQPTTSLQ